MQKIRSILQFLFPYWTESVLSVILNLFAAIFAVVSITMVIPFMGIIFSSTPEISQEVSFSFSAEAIQQYFNYIISKILVEQGQIRALVLIISVVAIASLFKSIFSFLSQSLVINIRIKLVRDLRNKILKKIIDFDFAIFSSNSKGNFLSNISSDVKEIEIAVIRLLEMLFKHPIMIIVYLYVLCTISLKLTSIVIILFLLSSIIIAITGKKLKDISLKGQIKMGLLMNIFSEVLSGIKIIKANNAEEHVEKRFNKINRNYSKLLKKSLKRRAMAIALSNIISVISILIVIWLGSVMVIDTNSGISSQAFIGYLAVLTQLIKPINAISNAYYNVQKGRASIERINSLFEKENQIIESENAKSLNEFSDCIEFKNVNFSYENQPVLKDLNFKIKKGQTIAIVGHSGAGKSTIIDLIPRFYDVDSGNILIDNISIKDYKIADIRHFAGYVSQQAILFNDTFYNNIKFENKNASSKQIIEAAKLANAHEFISDTQFGYYTNIGDDGNKLSHGQKQRISIARAILRNPALIILDEATNALDNKSEFEVQKAIYNLMQNRTIIIIAHRISTVKTADKIFFISNGKITESGTHNELIKNKGQYAELCELEMY
ncbi:MAG: ABC transporter ATP-binding protein [Bacteroidales bacterium]|jgi:subfamily B ATP-binding cassette protein MsbA|nr:ABC transporter ATP-binding protein [Bacteroidales bacterium]